MIEPKDGKTYWISINGGKPFLADYRAENKDRRGREAGPAWWRYQTVEELPTAEAGVVLTVIRELFEPTASSQEPGDGGPAFPVPGQFFKEGEVAMTTRAVPGMSLRDHFAGQALTGFIHWLPGSRDDPSEAAKRSFLFADAMIAEREKGRV